MKVMISGYNSNQTGQDQEHCPIVAATKMQEQYRRKNNHQVTGILIIN
jgi:hypothetical protein